MIINDKPRHYTGLSTDTKPNLGYVGEGYIFFESDSGLEYVYNAKIGSWIPMSQTTDTPCTGILKIEKTSSEGLIDYYTIYYTNGAETTYKVVNGAKGKDGSKITLSPNNTWVIDGVDTHVTAIGPQGIPGRKGDKGDQGETGKVVELRHKEDGIYSYNPDTQVENKILDFAEIKGEKGDTGERGPRGERGPQGITGEKGDTGNGIETITKTSSSPDGLTDTYTITFTNHETTTFDVKNGNGIVGFSKTSEGLVDTYTLEFADGSTQEFIVTNGESAYQIDKRLHSEDPSFPETETAWEDWIVPNINPNTLTWQIKGRDTGIYAKGSDEKYNIVNEGGRITINLLHNNAFICKANLNALTIVFPGNETFPDDDSIVPGWISEVTFKGSVSQDFVFLENIDTSKIKYYKFGRLRTGIHFETNSTINLIFQYDGLNVYCYITEISDDIAVD